MTKINREFEAWRLDDNFYALYVGAGYPIAIKRIKARKDYAVMATYHTREGKLHAIQFKIPVRLRRGLKSVLKRLEEDSYL